jgi:hypothetical protein
MLERIKNIFKKKEPISSEGLVPVEFKKKKEKIVKLKRKLINTSKIKNLFSNESFKIKAKFIKDLAIYSISYGVIINYMLWGIFGIKFGIFTFPAYGILFHFLKEELPIVWAKFFSGDK